MKEELHRIGVEKVDGIVLDLGVSSFQLDTPERGFTYRDENAPLDMRMDDRQSLTAKNIVNGYSEMDLYRIIRDYPALSPFRQYVDYHPSPDSH